MSDLQTYTIIAAVIVAAVAILIQTLVQVAMHLGFRAMKKQIAPLAAKLESVAEQAQRVLEEARTQIGEVTTRTREMLDLSRKQLVRADEFLEEATARARAQINRAEMVLDDTMSRFQETVSLLHHGVLQPLKQLHGVTLGVRTALGVLFGGRRTTVERATHDEEMFI